MHLSREKHCLATMYDELESSLRALESLGVTTSQSTAFLYPSVESSLPESLIQIWKRCPLSGYDDKEQEQPVDQRLQSLMKFLKKEVKGLEQLSLVNGGMDSSKTSKHKRKHQPHHDQRNSLEGAPTAAGLFVRSKSACVFCEKSHESKDW